MDGLSGRLARRRGDSSASCHSVSEAARQAKPCPRASRGAGDTDCGRGLFLPVGTVPGQALHKHGHCDGCLGGQNSQQWLI